MAAWLETVTLTQWQTFDATGRTAVLDALLERLPRGLIFTTHTGMMPGPVPQLIHTSSLVTFNLVFGGTFTFGMTDERRARALSEAQDEYGQPRLPKFHDAREVTVDSFLLADAPLVHAQMLKLGLSATAMLGSFVESTQVDALQTALSTQGWRLPSEEQYEYALRALSPEPLPAVPSKDDHPLAIQSLGSRELCTNGIIRGRGPIIDRRPHWFTELLWPGRRHYDRHGGAVRPVADLPPP